MFSQIYYLIRSRADGQYLVAKPNSNAETVGESYLLMFRERFEALSYLNTHASGVADRFTVESVPGTQLKHLLQRWGFAGIGVVQDPLVPQIEFLSQVSGF
ncbi:hypothetical protein [Lyngbya aestuarii]|uniref:hypothetical protein n=1 Tax=Lyngbya aestuarii TaxID=118322 RepID=UPI00403E27BF